MPALKNIITQTQKLNDEYRPLFFRLNIDQDKKAFKELLESNEVIHAHDEIHSQLKDLIKCLYPSGPKQDSEYNQLIKSHLKTNSSFDYGVWVYYPWNKRLVHILDEDEFLLVRTNRNRNKITSAEQQILHKKKIAIIGSSVGQSIALTLAMERVCGELRLADFDTLELSNLNRIRTGVFNLGLPKIVITAREIAEIDPFIKVELYNNGVTSENINDFLSGGGKTDILVEVCDNLEMKIYSRQKAKEIGIPVVMDTNDRGMLDIERFDIEPDRPILHGLLEDMDITNLTGLNQKEKTALILKIIDADAISQRLRASIPLLNKELVGLPQLSSSVVLGGAVTTDICRRILLNQLNVSGRFYIDLDTLVSNGQHISIEDSTLNT